MTITFPRDLVLEAYLGRWVDVTALAESRSLRQGDDVTVVWGSSGEQSKALSPPSTVEGVLNNVGGHWTPGNPMSDYFDYLRGRNVPTRLSLRVSRDAFGRTLPSSWGFTDTGDGWNLSGGTFSVGAGVGVQNVAAANSFVYAFLGDSYPDCQAAVTSAWNMNVAGGALEPGNLILRHQSSGTFSGEHYILRVSVSAAEVLSVAIHHSTLGDISGGGVVVATLTPGANSYRSKFQVEGQTLRGKVYLAGPSNDPDQFEPLGWQVSAHHERLTGGFPGIRTGAAAGNTNVPVAVSYDDWDLRLLRHSGELTSLEPTWDKAHRIKKARFKCADVTQRLGRPERPALSSAPRRYVASNAEFVATDFWPLDESSTAPAQGLSAMGGAQAIFLRETGVTPNRGAITWGETDQAYPSVPAFPTMSNGGRLLFNVNTVPLAGQCAIAWAMRLSPDAGAQVFLSSTAVINRFAFFFYTDGTYDLFSNPSGVSVNSGVVYPNGIDGRWVFISLSMFPAGGETAPNVVINGEFRGGNISPPDAGYSPLSTALFHVPQPTTGGQGESALSTVIVTADTLGMELSKAHQAASGWVGETALARAYRLTAEEGVPFDYYGDFGQTRTMGPQRPIPLLDQLQECAELDGALLYGPRYTPGVAFRGRRSMGARSADATLSYSAGMVADLDMRADDRPTANLVRAERINGGFLVVEQTSGPMNTKDPGSGSPVDPEAVGRSPADAQVNTDSDAQLGDVGGWVRALGTVPEVRFPRVTVNLRAAEVAANAVQRAVLDLRPGDRLAVTGPQAADVYRDLDHLVRGGRETYSSVRQHEVVLNVAPYEKYRSGVYGDAGSRYDGAVTTLDAQLTSGTTGARNVTTSAGPVWTVDAGAFPMSVLVGGELVTLSGITGTGLAAQVMTISARNVNALPTAGGKTWPAGTRVYLYQPVYYA